MNSLSWLRPTANSSSLVRISPDIKNGLLYQPPWSCHCRSLADARLWIFSSYPLRLGIRQFYWWLSSVVLFLRHIPGRHAANQQWPRCLSESNLKSLCWNAEILKRPESQVINEKHHLLASRRAINSTSPFQDFINTLKRVKITENLSISGKQTGKTTTELWPSSLNAHTSAVEKTQPKKINKTHWLVGWIIEAANKLQKVQHIDPKQLSDSSSPACYRSSPGTST